MKKIQINKTTKKIILCVLCLILGCSAFIFISNKIADKKLQDPEYSVNQLLDIFYGDKQNKRAEKVLLSDKTSEEYFNDLEKDLYDRVYDSIKDLGDEVLIDETDGKTVAKNYASRSVGMLKKVKKYEIKEGVKTEDGYIYTVEITPENLLYIYDIKNTCVVKKQGEYPEENYKTLINYYCSAEAMKESTDDIGASSVVTITLKKDKKGHYVPTKDSLNALLSVVV